MENRKKQTDYQRITNDDLGRVMPNAKEFENVVIGALMIEKQSFEIAKEIISAEMFYEQKNEMIFNAMQALCLAKRPIDMVTVVEQLRADGNLESVGGVFFVAQFTTKVVSSANMEYHCKIIKQQYVKRQFIKLCFQYADMAFSEANDIGDILYENSKNIEALQESMIGKRDVKPLNEILKMSTEAMYERKEKADKGIQPGITTGLSELDRKTGGWQKSELIILAARPAMGKTAMALHFAKRAAEKGVPVVMFSLEMSDVSLGNRLLLSETSINPDLFKLGKLSQQDTIAIEKAVGHLYNYPIYVDSNTLVTMDYIHSCCRLLKKRQKIQMVIIDYLQLAGEKGDKNRNRENEVSQMSREAKLIAKELDVPVILISQLNRDVDKRTSKVPVLSDLRESGAIEQDADMVIFIHRPEYYFNNVPKGYGDLIVAKYRNGYTGKIAFQYNESLTKIYDAENRQEYQTAPLTNCYEPQTVPF